MLVEPTAIERSPEKVTWELEIVTEQEKRCVLMAVDFICASSKELDSKNPSFGDRLEYLRRLWPPAVTKPRSPAKA